MPYTLATEVSFEEDIKKVAFRRSQHLWKMNSKLKAFLEKHLDTSTTHQCWAWKVTMSVLMMMVNLQEQQGVLYLRPLKVMS